MLIQQPSNGGDGLVPNSIERFVALDVPGAEPQRAVAILYIYICI